MYELGMSSKAKKEPVFGAYPSGDAEQQGNLVQFADYILEEETGDGLGRILIRSGFVALFAFSVYAGYHYVQGSAEKRQLADGASRTDWAGRPLSTTEDGKLAWPDKNAKPENIDPTHTASIKHQGRIITERPVPITRKNAATANGIYIVKPGDTLSGIGRAHKISTKQIMAINGIENPRLIKPGMKLKVSN